MERSGPTDFLGTTGLLAVVAASGALVIVGLFLAVAVGGAPAVTVVAFLAGVVIWTLLEYLKHRFCDHRDAGHLEHHRAPLEDIRIKRGGRQAFAIVRNMLLLAGPAAVGAWFVDAAAVSAVLGAGAGLLAGYVAYRIVHVACHELPMRHPWAAGLKRHHAIHHFRDETANFGITPTLWDHVFGTAWKPAAGTARGADEEGRSA